MVLKHFWVKILSTFFVKDKPVFSNATKNLSKNPFNYCTLCNWGFDNFILATELFAKALQIYEICVLVNNNLFGKSYLSLELPIIFWWKC